MQTLKFNVQGMSCGSCVKHVRTALLGVAGVREVSVDLERGEATVLADVGVGFSSLRDALSEAGYESAQ